MSMTLTLESSSTANTIALPNELFTHLQAKSGDSIVVTCHDGQITIRSIQTALQHQMNAAQCIMQRYRHTLSELAK
ncbi:MAG TPA: hypothetical protein VGE29_10035 [Prosthecobacter sp.]